MAEVYKRVRGMPIQKAMAKTTAAQNGLDGVSLKHGMRAERLLDQRADVRTGTSFIEVETGNVDRYVVLNDERGFGAAMTIEYGRQDTPDQQGSEGLWVLHDAFGLGHQ